MVSERAKKLKVEVFQAISNKADALLEIVSNRKLDIQRVFYVGNDINDYHVMQLCGYTACPNDSHIKIKKISDYTLLKNGGDGIVREILEEIFSLNLIKLIT